MDFSKEKIDALLTTGVTGSITSLLIRALVTLIIFLIGVKVIKIIRKVVRKSMEKAKAEMGVITFVDSFIKAALYVVLIFVIASRLGVDAASIVAILGSAGVAIGLAVQGSLSNFAGGVLILLLKPFKVGDYIVDASGKEGTVSEIQIFYTKLHTADNKVVILPNGNLANNSIINVTAEKVRRIDIFVQVSYQADLKKAKEVLKSMLDENHYSLKDRDRVAFVNSLDDSGVTMGVRCWVNASDYWQAKWDLTENCKLCLDRAGIEIPFPQMD
ncbi:MAG: mechanosensitive ion channel, partial [Lachnospiraceae bacterium]|nr:mechanosensitive ion channel [Lachnospiraceae bacterium]